MTRLPQDFMDRMQDMLGEAYPAFLRSYEEEKKQALRVNVLKGSVEDFLGKAPFALLGNVPWEKNGFYYGCGSQPGKHPLHEAGAYYIQEPSAMAPAAYLGAAPGERILDLCAAPGGKTAQIAAAMRGGGLLVCNEIHPARAKILSENVERMGIRNALVTNETPQHLAEAFGEYFDRILVDAPCSGEGMFRRNQEACGEWSLANVQACADRQDGICDCADRMLRPGGRLVYATCTFAPAENEGSVARFLARHPGYRILEIPLCGGMGKGRPDWLHHDGGRQEDLARTVRLFPHLSGGEGHYFAVMQKSGACQRFPSGGIQKGFPVRDAKELIQFCGDTLETGFLEKETGSLLRFGSQLYLMPEEMPPIDGLRILRAGLHLGELRKNRFEPSHALALALKKEDARRVRELANDDEARAYLGGMTLSHHGGQGWYLITYMGYSIGWGKLAGQIMKNHYPKGLRK